MKFFALVIPAVAIKSAERSEFASLTLESAKDVETMRDEFRSMAVRGEKISTETMNLVRQWMGQLENELGADIKSDFDAADQSMIDAQRKIEECATDRDTNYNVSFDVPTLKQNATDAKASFYQCQHDRLDECNAACDKCDELDDRINTWINIIEPRWFDWCAGDSSSVYGWVFHLDEFLDDNAAYYFLTKQECSDLTTTCNDRVAECNQKQTNFEVDTCTWLTTVDEICSMYDSCYKCGVENFRDVQKEANCIFDLANVQKQALEQCLCYGEAILNETTDLSVCDDIVFVPWTIPTYQIHDEIYCSERERDVPSVLPMPHNWFTRPCSIYFVIEHYFDPATFGTDYPVDWYDEAAPTVSKTPITTCTTCHDTRPYPFHLVARGACRSDTESDSGTDNTYGRLGSAGQGLLSAEQCVDACRETDGCTMVSWHADAHHCWMDYGLDDIVYREHTGWSCYTERYADAYAVRQKNNISEDEYEELGATLLQVTESQAVTECTNLPQEECL